MIIAGIIGGMWILIVVLISLVGLLLPLFAIIDIVRNDFEGNNKLLWILIVLFLPFAGSIIYFLIGRDQRYRRY